MEFLIGLLLGMAIIIVIECVFFLRCYSRRNWNDCRFSFI